MLRKDFFDGGFPISRRSPVICTFLGNQTDNKSPRNFICYNRFDLKLAIESCKIKEGEFNCFCVGIWPGKKTTDGFTMNPQAYIKNTPEEMHKDIDSASSITVVFYTDNTFSRLLYTPGDYAGNQTPVMSQDKNLYEYVKNVGLKFISVIE